MNEQFDQFSQSIDFFRNLGIVSLSGSQELISWQLDNTQSFIALGSQQLRNVMSDAGAVHNPEQWPEAVPTGLRSAIDITRDCLLTASACQIEGLRLLEKQVAEARNLLAESLSAQSPKMKLVRTAERKNNKTASIYAQQYAA